MRCPNVSSTKMFVVIFIFTLIHLVPTIHSIIHSTSTPSEVATLVGNSFILHANTFINWEGGFQYGGAITSEGLMDAASIVNTTTRDKWMQTLDTYLDMYMQDNSTNAVACDDRQPYGASTKTRSCAWSIYNNQTLSPKSWELSTVGDSLGAFPLSYLKRYEITNGSTKDAIVSLRTVTKYIYPFTHRLKDNTISRNGGCCKPPPRFGNKSPYIWADDQFMGLALMARLSTAEKIVDLETRTTFINRAALMQLNFAKYLIDPVDGLSFHGAYVEDENNEVLHSCCKWGRANGWGALSRVEVLKAIDRSFPNYSLRKELIVDFKKFMASMIKYQSNDGRWHQVINETSTYLETSVTAMMITAIAEGVVQGWLKRTKYQSVIELAWKGLLKTIIHRNGTVTVSGVCMGTGIQSNLTGYATRGTDYMQSAPGGVGSVLIACSALDRLEKYYKNIEILTLNN